MGNLVEVDKTYLMLLQKDSHLLELCYEQGLNDWTGYEVAFNIYQTEEELLNE